MIRLHNLKPRPGSRHRVKRLGCGESLIQLKISNMGSRRRRERLTLLHDVCDQNP